jgi:DNA-directed RNA polymerase subunit RPC12/RpoP
LTNEEFMQELKKRKIAKLANKNKKMGGEIYECPNCKKILGSIIFKKPNFCYKCGQALLFKEGEENDTR